ncbi:MAG: hypothetical protein EOP86_11510 [Verrucomicrobiaceae bacterium]|nr:MAG: hypothetical protein EOP86_11510 [Verrucomicrobiaceae bacterium]
MILAFDDDEVTALADVAQANTWCEGIDVEAGLYTFIDEHGFLLSPRFIFPNRRGKTLELFAWVESGFFTLDRTHEKRRDLLADVIAGHVTVCAGPGPLSTQEMLREYLLNTTSSGLAGIGSNRKSEQIIT